MNDKDQILALEQRLAAAMLNNDIAELGALIADDLLFVGPDGTIVGKTDDLDMRRSGRLTFSALDVLDRRVTASAGMAHVIARARLSGSANGAAFAGNFIYTRIWVKSGDSWRVQAGHVSAIAGLG